jgi:hypothetical protein
MRAYVAKTVRDTPLVDYFRLNLDRDNIEDPWRSSDPDIQSSVESPAVKGPGENGDI